MATGKKGSVKVKTAAAEPEFKFRTTADLKVPGVLIDQIVGQEDAVQVIRKAAKQRRHVLLIGDPGTGKCVGKDSAIQLSDGSLLTAEELAHQLSEGRQPYALAVNPDLSLSHSRILKAGKTEAQSLALKTNGGKTITVSLEHPFLTISESGISWKHAGELSERSFVATARRLEAPEQLQQLPPLPLHYAPTRSHSNVKSITLPEFFNEDFAEWCGYLWSEGYIARKISITFTNSEERLIKRFAEISKQLFGLETHIRHFPHKHAFVATVNSSTLVHALEQFGWGKKIPDMVLKSPQAIMRSFLRAYFDGDGSATKRGFEVTTKNHFVALQLQSMLLRFGITSVLRKRMCRATNSAMQPKAYTALLIYDTRNLAKLTHIGFSIPRKMERLLQLQGKKAQSNIDKAPHIGKLIFELKEKLRLTSEDIGIGVHQFRRYLQGTRTPTLTTLQKAIKVFSQRFVALRTVKQRILTDGSVDLGQLSLELGISKAALAQRTGMQPRQIEHALSSHDSSIASCVQALVSECVTDEVESKLIGLYQLASADVVWERITKITDAGIQELYDFEAEKTHNFLANNIFVHNSMMGMAMAELLPKEKLVSIMAFSNPNDENQPLIRVVPAHQGRDILTSAKLEAGKMSKHVNLILVVLLVASLIMPWWAYNHYTAINPILGGIMFLTFSLFGFASMVSFILFLNLGRRIRNVINVPKIVVNNFEQKTAPFYDATGAHAGALLGDVLHDPFQTGGLGTPAHERVVAGMIHKAHMGVLFIDEIAILEPSTQQELLTALQEGRYPITGQSERSAGAMVRTEPVPCNFILVAAGNVETVARMHPALRSRIRGYGYEVYMRNTMEDTPENRVKIAQFVAQEVVKDKKIPQFTVEAVNEIITEAKRRANRKGHLSLLLRDLGGIVRAAGDLAQERGSAVVERQHVLDAKRIARPLEQQIADKIIEQRKEYDVIVTTGKHVGRVNGLAVLGGGATFSGIILPIEAEVVPGGEAREIIATGKLGAIAKEAVKNVSAIIKKYFGEDIKKKHDIYVQFLQTYEGVEGDSASIAVATAIISALKGIPVKQEYAMTGSLSVRGEVLPVGGVSAKVEAAIETGITKVIVPKSNVKDIILDKAKAAKVSIIPVETIVEVLREALDWKGKEAILKKIVGAKPC